MRQDSLLTAVSLAASFAVSLAAASACHRAPPPRARVAVSVFPVYDLVRRIAGSDADVTLVTPGASDLRGATLVVLVGLGLDAWMETLEAPKTRVLKVGDRVPTITGSDGAIDPHVWLDPQRARLVATAIAEDLARADSSHAGAFRERAATLDASLDALDHEVDARAATWTSRAFVTRDLGMAYYAERYRLRVSHEPAPGLPSVVLDSVGGTARTDSYEALIRLDTAALESALR